MSDTAPKSMTVEEFFEWQRAQEDRFELVDGYPVKMMTGASNFHDVILMNIAASLHGQLRGGPCWVATPDTAIRTKIRSLRRADVTVTCNPPRPDSYEAREPRLIVEVLSKSNTGRPWQRKLDEYWRLQGLAYVLLIDSLTVGATLYTRTDSGWDPTDADDRDAVLEMPAIKCRLAMRDAYEGLSFDDRTEAGSM